MSQIIKLYLAAIQKNSKRRKMRRTLVNKTNTKSVVKQGWTHHCGRQEPSKRRSSSVSTLLRTKMPSPAQRAQWIAWFWPTSMRIDTDCFTYMDFSRTSATIPRACVKKIGLLPEFDGYIPYVGETAHGDLKTPTREQLAESFTKHAKNGKLGGRELDTYLKGVSGIRVLCRIMKYLVQIGITPQLINSKAVDILDEDDERQLEARREASDFVRKILSGAFAVRSYDYFRVAPPQREDHIHLDPIELVCAVPERCKTFTVLVTLNKIGLELPPQLRKVWQGKLKAVQQSASQMTTCIRSLDPAERENARQYIRALGDTQPAEEPASSSTKESDAMKRSAGSESFVVYIIEEDYWEDSERRTNSWNPMYLGCEDFLVQWINFQGRMNRGEKPYSCNNSEGAWNAEGIAATVSTQSHAQRSSVQSRSVGDRWAEHPISIFKIGVCSCAQLPWPRVELPRSGRARHGGCEWNAGNIER